MRIKRLLHLIPFALVVLIFISVCLITAGGGRISIFGYTPMIVLTPSMQDEIPEDSFILTKKVPTDTIDVGDNITVKKGAKSTVTHKVVKIVYENGVRNFITKGTMNNAEDKPAPETDVVGLVTFQNLTLGKAIVFCQKNILYILIGIVAIIGGVSLIKYFIKKGRV
jgi:signal peptidase I, archaeal type